MRRTAVLVLTSLLGAGCVEDVGFPSTKALVRVDVGRDGIEVSSTSSRPLTPREQGGTLRVTFADADGRVLREQTVADPRVRRIEWLDDEAMQSEEQDQDAGSLYLSLPAVSGELTVTEDGPDGPFVVGRATVEPPGAGVRELGLLSDRDASPPRAITTHGSPQSAVDILFVPEGYTQQQLANFDRFVQDAADGLAGRPDFGPYSDRINIWAQDVVSRQSGVDDSGRGVQVDTAFDFRLAKLNPNRPENNGSNLLVECGTEEARRALVRLRDEAHADALVVVVNSPRYFRSTGGEIAHLYPGDGHGATDLVAHELGHTLIHLWDEYDDSPSCETPPTGPNISPTSTRSRLPWTELVDRATPLPTPARIDEIGAYACARGFRPEPDCLMRTPSTRMCTVCQGALDEVMAAFGGGGDTEDLPGGGGGGWTCDAGYRGTGDGCDCGCGARDPDCGQAGCAEPGCAEAACEYCYDSRGQSTACPAANAGGGQQGNGGGGGSDGAAGCAEYDWSTYCRDGDDFCDEGDGCCENDSDDHDGGPCAGGAGAGGNGDGTGAAACADYDWGSYCVDGDDYCDEGDGCCTYDEDDHDGGACEGGAGAGGQAGGDDCTDYDWDTYCVDGDDYCDEGDGCCGYDEDDHDDGPCEGTDEGATDCSDYDWDTYCVDGDSYCDQGDGCCTYDSDDDAGTCSGGDGQDDGPDECEYCDEGVHVAVNGGPCDCEGSWRVVTLDRFGAAASQVCRAGSWVTFNLDPRDPAGCCGGDFWGCCRNDQGGQGCS